MSKKKIKYTETKFCKMKPGSVKMKPNAVNEERFFVDSSLDLPCPLKVVFFFHLQFGEG